jgi:phage terminase small subunit
MKLGRPKGSKDCPGESIIPDLDDESLGPAMRALKPAQRRFALAAVQFPLAKDWQIAKAAGYSDFSHGALRVTAHRLFHDEMVLAAIHELAVKEIRSSALLGIATIQKIARRDGHKDQMKAAVHLVGLAGHTVEQKISVQQTTRDLTGDAILNRIQQLAQKLGVDATKLLGPAAAPVVEGEFSEVKDG